MLSAQLVGYRTRRDIHGDAARHQISGEMSNRLQGVKPAGRKPTSVRA
jgi:hypothetical protein